MRLIKNKEKYLPRVIDKQIERYLKIFGAICIKAPKWCGKTSTANMNSKSNIYIGDPAGNFQNKALAEVKPKLVLSGDFPRLIDEWQEVPQLWNSVRFEVD